MRPDFVGVDAAENQQMVILGQVVQGPDRGIEPLVAPEKAKDADQPAVLRHLVEDGKPGARGAAANVVGLVVVEKRQRMIEDIAHTVHETYLGQIAAGVNDRLDHRLEGLRPAQPAGDPGRQQMSAQ